MRRPGLAALVVGLLAAGTGSATGVFSIVRAVLLRPLPYHEPDRLVVLWTQLREHGEERPVSSGPELLDYRERLTTVTDWGALWYRPGALTDDASEPEDIDMAFVSAGFREALQASA